jgi:hypothetical protein
MAKGRMITSAQHLSAALRFDFWNWKLGYSRDVDGYGSSAGFVRPAR